jgi:HEAT repeat protein
MQRNVQRTRRTSCGVRPLVFVFACLIFSSAGYSQDLGQLAARLRSGNSEEKRTVLMELRGLRSDEASRIAATALSDDDAIVRATAASAVLFLPKPEAAAALLPLLSDKDDFVRREAVSALGEVGDPIAAGPLAKSLNSDKSAEVRTAAAVALGKVGDLTAVTSLLAILNAVPKEETEMIRRAAARSIGQIAQIMRSGRVRVVTPQNFLPEKYKDIDARPSPDLLSHFTNAVKRLTQVLESSSEADDTRREAAFALGAIGDPSSVAVLQKYLASSDPYLAEIAKEALLKLGTGN